MSEQLEIHLKDGTCKIFQGQARRVFYSTDEALALALLKMRPANSDHQIQWADFLPSHGIAFGVTGHKTITLICVPEVTRTIRWEKAEISVNLTVCTPPLLWAVKMVGSKLIKTQLWLIKKGFEQKLSTTLPDHCLHYFPYGNVYNYGDVCWGHANINQIKHPSEVDGAFFSSVFNGDLWAPLAFGAADTRLYNLVDRVGKELPIPPAANYVTSVASVVREMVR